MFYQWKASLFWLENILFYINQNALDYPIQDPQNTILDATSEEIQRYFPTPSPRKNVANVAPTQNPPSTTYMNVPVVVNRAGPPMHRLESVTPNRLVSDYAEEQHRINMADEAATGDFYLTKS